MRILVTGAGGMLGQDLLPILKEKHEDVLGADVQEFDITDTEVTHSFIESARPEIVIHLAAYTDVDACECNPDLAYRVNTLGTRNVAIACQDAGATLVYTSTDYVFDGKAKTPYTEFDEPNPKTVYGKSKLAGEEFVRLFAPKHFIVRTSWLYGKHGRNFVDTILKLADEREELTVVDDQVGCPTYTVDLSRKIAELIETRKYGTYHICGSGSTSWFGFARKILEYSGRGTKLTPITSSQLGRPAPRPAYSAMRQYALELEGFAPLRDWREALKEYLSPKPPP
ncbi:MAG: dTDP-4-dehydrorhamnose reductase [bacterium]